MKRAVKKTLNSKKVINDKLESAEIEFDQSVESEEEDNRCNIPLSERIIYTDKGDPEIDSLYGKKKRGKLILQSDFQRQFVWDIKMSSRLIESVLLDIPIPVIYLSHENDGKEYVIDGQQRLNSFFSFIDGEFPDGREFKLTGLEENGFKELNGKKFENISKELQDKIIYYKLRTITFLKNSDPNLKFKIFERLNMGSVSLNSQELRNCMYKGHYNDLLKELSENKDFRYLLGLGDMPEKRMRDVELVLRFAAFYHSTYLKYKPSIKTFLNSDMDKHRAISEKDLDELKNAFKNAVSIIKSLLDKHAFKRFYKGSKDDPNGEWETKTFNTSLYDVLMYTFAKAQKNVVYQHLDAIRELFINLMVEDQDFIDAIDRSTSSTKAVRTRFKKFEQAVEEIIGINPKEHRCFTKSLKEKLYDTDSACAICNQQIQHIDDAAVDHIKQYWKGGKTIPTNARLTHRYCNFARSRND